MAYFRFLKSEIVLTQPWIELYYIIEFVLLR